MISRSMPPILTVDVEPARTGRLPSAPSMAVAPIGTDAALAGLKENWDALQTETASPNPFLTWGWMASWWRHFGEGKRLEILAVRDHGELIGIAPFYLETVRVMGVPFRRLALLGDRGVGSDHLDLISRKGFEEDVASAVARFWREARPEWDFVQLRGFAEASPSLSAFMKEIGGEWKIEAEEEEVCPYLPLDPTWDDYLKRLSGSMRYTIRRKIRNLEKEYAVELVLLEEAGAGREAMERLIDLHRKRWNAQGGSAAFVSEAKAPFHRETSAYFFEKGIAKLFLLKVNGGAVASLYGFAMGGKFFYYQAGFDPAWGDRSVGTVLMAKSIEAAIGRGWSEFDFLRGPETYKSHWTSSLRKIWRVSLYPPRFRGALYRNLSCLRQRAKKAVKNFLPDEWVKKIQASRENGS